MLKHLKNRYARKVSLLLFFLMGCAINPVSAQNFIDSNLPIVIITTDLNVDIPDEPGVLGTMKIIYRGQGQRNYMTDQTDSEYLNYDGRIDIEVRGSSSQGLPKKQYRLTTLQADNISNNNVSLLGMPRENDWVLNGLAFDASLMRDYLSYNLSRNMGAYAPRTAYCEVIINGNYAGLYVLQEKIKADDNRVDIHRIDPTDNMLPVLSGGYITKTDKVTPDDPSAWTMQTHLNSTVNFIHEFPKPADITTEQHQYIKGRFEKLSITTANSSFSNGFPSIIDVPSFIDFMIINELTANVDAYQFSTFFHKDKNGKLRAGPIWDLNLTFGNDLFMWGFDRSKYNLWQFDNGDNVGPKFWKDLFNNPDFKCYLAKRWTELTQDGAPLSLAEMHTLVDETATTLNEASVREQARWGTITGHAQEIISIKAFMQSRMNWMNTNIGSAANCQNVVTPPLVITRIMYNPDTSPSFVSSSDQEFIEIANNGNETVDLTGVYFSGTGFVYQFYAGTTLPPGEVIQLANDRKTFTDRYGFLPFGEFTRDLSNTSQQLTLADGFGNVIDEVFYTNSAPWPDANANGYHIKLIDPDLDNSSALNWVATDEAISSNVVVVGIEDETQSIELHPNPVHGSFTLETNSPAVSWKLLDYQGRLLETRYASSNSVVIDMTRYSRGLYFISITTHDWTVVRKVMKK